MTTPNYLYIDSKNRTTGTSNDFIINLQTPLTNLNEVSLMAVSIPITSTNVSSFNNLINFSTSSTAYVATVTSGIYDVNSIIPAVQNAMNATSYGGTVTMTYNPATYMYTITSTIPISLTFGTNTTHSIANFLGFNSVDTTLATGQTATNISNLSIPPAFFLNIQELPNSILTSTGYAGTFMIFVTVNSGYVNFNFEANQMQQKVNCNKSNILSRISVQLLDPRTMSTYNLNGADWVFMVQLKTHIF
jgi:hypothetical protein